jgi:hypothetical protein
MTVQIGRMPGRRCSQLLIVREPGQTRLQAQPFHPLEFPAGVRWQPGPDCQYQGDEQDVIAGSVHVTVPPGHGRLIEKSKSSSTV